MFDHQIWLWPLVRRRLKHVKVNEQAITALADKWAKEDFLLPDWRLPVLPSEDDDDFVQFLGINSALNFGLVNPVLRQSFAVDWRDQTWTGSKALSACLMRAVHNYDFNLLDADFLANLSLNQVRTIFYSPFGKIPLLEERWKILNKIGQTLDNLKLGGRFSSLLRAANYRVFNDFRPERRCLGIISWLVNYFPTIFGERNYYRPARQWYGLYKKARLFIAMYHGRAAASNGRLPPIEDINQLEPIIDYRVAAALRWLDILRYDQELESEVKAGVTLPARKRKEQEIRLAAEHAVAELLRQINDRRPRQMGPINICHLDYRLWQMSYPSHHPHHLTLTTAY